MILKELFPSALADDRWASIVARMIEDVPARRPAHAGVLREEIEKTFALSPALDRMPPFGAGRMRGRDDALLNVGDQARTKPGSRLLIQGRPGVGLSRFLREAVLEIASKPGPPVRMIDLTSLPPGTDFDLLSGWLRQGDGRETVLLGVGDPSPGFRWLDESRRKWLESELRLSDWARSTLLPLDQASCHELIATSLGTAEPVVHALAEALCDSSDGDLGLMEEGFKHCLRRCGHETDLAWTLDPAGLAAALADWHPGPRPPRLDQVPAPLLQPLRTCAWLGPSFPEGTARDLLAAFGHGETLPALIDHGYLHFAGDHQIRLATRGFWRALEETEPERGEEIDGWLLRHHAPDPAHLESVWMECRRARRRGDREKEALYLASALPLAHSQRRWNDVLRLLAYPAEPEAVWTVETLRSRVAATAELVGSHLDPDWLLFAAAESVNMVDRALGGAMLNELAEIPKPGIAQRALTLLVGFVVHLPDSPEFRRYIARMRQEVGRGLNPGLIDHYLARHAFATGDHETAVSMAERAASQLRSSGLIEEPLNLQVLAILRFQRDQQAGIAATRDALNSTKEPELIAQIACNLSRMYTEAGELEEAAECADDALRMLQGRISGARSWVLRIARAWCWAQLDRIALACREATALVSTPIQSDSLDDRMNVLSLLGFCLLHRGSRTASLRAITRAWMIGRDGAPQDARSVVLSDLIGAILDLEAWEVIPELELGSVKPPAPDESMNDAVVAQAKALLAQADGRLADAESILQDGRAAGGKIEAREYRARYSYHLGLVQLWQGARIPDVAAARRAEATLQEALAGLPARGFGYNRARILLAISEAQWNAGEAESAKSTLTRAIALARSLQCLGVLARCLEVRARREIGSGGSGGGVR